ncbi:microtubule-associated protein futsch-like isoform X2 [Stegodyphus dumicola]|uniref:microtubule-associated protein futsch-like isoform X2 n=1 Tax=Stegodyphus dumicola TaxID=202533 RepID=UPI0015A89898|nr:microtubule-associated protein futsch-like isoform X2 [Stegodyphus dumicola]
MEKQQADSLQKSPVPKPVTSTDTEINGQSTQVLTNGSHLDKSPESTEKLPSATYQDGIPCKESFVDKKPIESADLDEKTKTEVKKSIDGEEVPHAIISVDIQKSMPYEKHAVPQEVGKDSKGDVPPEVLASVVTTAVVNEAALTVSGTDASIINGTKIVSDSSKVDAVVEQELSKMSDLKTDNIELQNGEESSKPILNGDIDHSPLSEDTTAETASHLTETSTSSKEEIKATKEVSDKKDTTHPIKLESELPKQSISETSSKLEDTSVEKRQSIDGGQVNGVPGIITVESITKRESTEIFRGEEIGSVTDADKQKYNIETMTSNSVTLSEDLENVKGVPGNVKETDANKNEPESSEKLSKPDEMKSDKETKVELPSIEHKVADDNLTDSAKLLRENLTDSAKLKTEITEKPKIEPLVKSESEIIMEVHKTKIVDAAVDKSKEETPQKSKAENIEQQDKKEEDSSKSKDQVKKDDTLYAAKLDEGKIEEKGAKESKDLEQKSEVISEKDSKESSSATEVETSTFLEKKEIDQKDITSDEASPKISPLPDESIKTKEICDIQTTKSPSLSPKKTKTEEGISPFITSVPISEEGSKSEGVASEPQTEKSIAEEMAESNKTSETVCDMSLMMTSQILTPELLSAEEDTESIEKTKEVSETLISGETRKDDTREKSLEKSDVTELQREESCRISAARYSPETCDVAVGLDEHRMIRVAAGDGGEEEVDGQQASAEVELTDEALQSHTDEDAGSENIMGNGAASPSSGTPSSDRVASSAKISATPSSKPSSGISQKDDESQKDEDSKPASAVSRSSIPDPIIYEPPERRKSATSTTSEDKKDLDADKSQNDEQESEKSAERKAEEERTEETSAEESDKKEEVKIIDNKSETTKEVADSKAEEKVSITTGDEEKEKEEKDLDINKEVEKEDESKKAIETEKVTEEKTEKGVEDEKEKETIESKREVPETEKESDGEKAKGVDNIKAPTEKTSEAAKETADSQPAEISGSQSPTPSVKEDDKSDKASEKRDEALDKHSEESSKEKPDEETKSEESIAEKEKEVSAEKSEEEGKLESLEKQDKPESSEKEDKAEGLDKEARPEVSQMEDKAEISQKEEKAEISKEETEITKKEADSEISEKEVDKTNLPGKEDKAEISEKERESQTSEKEDKAEVPEKEDEAEISEKEKEAEISTDEKETSEKEDRPTTPEKDSAEPEAKTTVTEVLEEPKTLVQEESKVDETSEKEAGKSEEKEEDDTEKETTPDEEVKKEDKEEDQEKIAAENEVKKEAETTVIEEAETVKIEETEEAAEKPEEEEEKPSASITEEAKSSEVGAEKEEPAEEEKTAEDAEEARKSEESEGEAEKGESEAEEEKKDEEKKEPEQEDEEEKQDEGKEHEEKPESPPKSPTKRMRSPDKAGRRGVSPISSPPKPLKTPPSPQKPQKSTSPKKKNGMLSPVKVPKTPGSDTRKLPPIKAPVGLAPNPNLKNIRSKIGSFDNIRYKPGGGDKKVISKKLEWKATPKIGSLDHSFKSGERKHGKSHSKGDLKDGKLADGQSPLPSGDEGETEGATAVAETLIKPDGSGSTEMPAAITAES